MQYVPRSVLCASVCVCVRACVRACMCVSAVMLAEMTEVLAEMLGEFASCIPEAADAGAVSAKHARALFLSKLLFVVTDIASETRRT